MRIIITQPDDDTPLAFAQFIVPKKWHHRYSSKSAVDERLKAAGIMRLEPWRRVDVATFKAVVKLESK